MHFMLSGRPAESGRLTAIREAYAGCGIFCVCDMGHAEGVGAEARELFKSAVRVRTAVSALHRRGGYGPFLGGAVEGVAEAVTAVRELAEAGADFIKVINSGIVRTSEEGGVTEGGFYPDELKAMVTAAGKSGLKVVCHANGDEAIYNAVKAGASSIEHGFFVSDKTLIFMKEREVSWTPTLFALQSLSAFSDSLERRRIEGIIARHCESVEYAASIGVKLAVGTDSGSRGVEHGTSFIEELRLFRKAGLSLEQILQAACMEEEEIEKGNYLLVKDDFIETGRIETVVRKGRPVSGG